MKGDLIECVVVLPTKLFYGNSVPGCLVILNKRKAPERKNKILFIWATRHYQSNNPQNLLRRADCLRILVPWRGFGNLEKCKAMVLQCEAELFAEIERERDAALADIEDAYAPFLTPLSGLRNELTEREASSEKETPTAKDEKKSFREEKKKNADRLKIVKREIKALEKLEVEADEKRTAVRLHAEREIALCRDSSADLLRTCSDTNEAKRYFVVADRSEIEENEFNLHLPRYLEISEPEEQVSIDEALSTFETAENLFQEARQRLMRLLEEHVH